MHKRHYISTEFVLYPIGQGKDNTFFEIFWVAMLKRLNTLNMFNLKYEQSFKLKENILNRMRLDKLLYK